MDAKWCGTAYKEKCFNQLIGRKKNKQRNELLPKKKSFFSFVACTFSVISKISLPNPVSYIVFLTSFSESFIVLAFMFRFS